MRTNVLLVDDNTLVVAALTGVPRSEGCDLRRQDSKGLTCPHRAPFIFTRLLVQITAFALFIASGGSGLAAMKTKPPADVALLQLKVGSAKFAADTSTPTYRHARDRTTLAEKQKPFAIVVSCSDSRVGPEVVFDQGLGDLFVVRTAGHVVDGVGLGSIEYAVEQPGASLVVVLGHERCGAVAATVAGGSAREHLPAIIKAIKPAVAKSKKQPGDAVDNAVRKHVRAVVAQLQKSGPILAERVQTGQLKAVGARYDLDTGRVEFL